MERLQKILSAAGVASRRAAEVLIVEGRVSVNGRIVRELGTKADPDRDDIRVRGRRIKAARRRRYLLLNKPRGYVTTRSDPEHRPTVMDLLKGVREYVYPVGRLDYDSEGLLLLTNDGELAARLMHPRHAVARVYEVRVRGLPDAHAIARLAKGVLIERAFTGRAPSDVRTSTGSARTESKGSGRARRTSPARARVVAQGVGAKGDQAVIELTIFEGRTRQVRKMCEAVGHPVVRLRRIRIGPIADPALKPGQFRELTAEEVARLKREAFRD